MEHLLKESLGLCILHRTIDENVDITKEQQTTTWNKYIRHGTLNFAHM